MSSVGHQSQTVRNVVYDSEADDEMDLDEVVEDKSKPLARPLKRPFEESLEQSDPREGEVIAESKKSRTEEGPVQAGDLNQTHRDLVNIIESSKAPYNGNAGFSFWDAVCQHHSIFLEIAKHMDFYSLFNLFCIQKDAFIAISTNMYTVLTHQANVLAPESASVFPFKCYSDLCVIDPQSRTRNTLSGAVPRCVPSFKWLRFIYFREDTVMSIIRNLARAGHRMPVGSTKVLKRLWFLMDLPDTKRRQGMIHNQRFWSTMELETACLFFIKLDMRLNDPMTRRANLMSRAMLMAQRSLSVVDQVLRRKKLRNTAHVMRMFAEWRVRPDPQYPNDSVFGVPPQRLGRLACEGWTQGNQQLMAIDELVIAELVRRGLDLQNYLIDFVIYGNIDQETGKDIEAYRGSENEDDEYVSSDEEYVRDLEKKYGRVTLGEPNGEED